MVPSGVFKDSIYTYEEPFKLNTTIIVGIRRVFRKKMVAMLPPGEPENPSVSTFRSVCQRNSTSSTSYAEYLFTPIALQIDMERGEYRLLRPSFPVAP